MALPALYRSVWWHAANIELADHVLPLSLEVTVADAINPVKDASRRSVRPNRGAVFDLYLGVSRARRVFHAQRGPPPALAELLVSLEDALDALHRVLYDRECVAIGLGSVSL